MKIKAIIITVAAAMILIGCAVSNTSVDTTNSTLTHGNVQMNIRVGETTQTQILELFGAPNITTIDGTGQEVWSYQRAATVTQSSSNSGVWTIFLAGGSSETSGFSSTSRMITLIIKFNKDKIVSDFSSRSSNF
jgi:outer membrane protein assembly factor BamE (lipoprotein component of BamABCDE complex)